MSVIRRLIPTKVRAILERVMETNDDVLFLGGDLDKPITISAAICCIRDSLPIEDWRTHDFRRSLSTGASELGVMHAILLYVEFSITVFYGNFGITFLISNIVLVVFVFLLKNIIFYSIF